MLNLPPPIWPLGAINLIPPEVSDIGKGVKLYGYNGGQIEIIKIAIVFDAGRWTEPAPLVADAVARLIKSGTAAYDSVELSGNIDLYGASIKAEAGYNTFTLSLSCLNRHLEASLVLMKSCLKEILFPEKEIHLLREKSIMRLKVNLERNEYVADMALKEALFGQEHPYGYETREKDILAINQELLLQYYHNQLTPENASIFVCGKYTDREIRLIADILHPADWDKGVLPVYPEHVAAGGTEKHIHREIPGSVQSSIAMGMHLFNRQHQDFTGVALMNTIFGGYFGSRLMQNIREDKGMTYGIYAEIQTYKHGGLLLISTETAVKHTASCLKEIRIEADKLKTELVGDKELTQARNYLLGKMLSRTDGPFNKSSAFKNLFIEGYDEKKFDRSVEEIRHMDSKYIRELAEKYLHTENMHCVVVS